MVNSTLIKLKKNLYIKGNGLDKQSFEALFKDHFKFLTYFALEYVKDYDTAREIVQEVFANLWEKRASIDLDKSPRSYLGTSVRNRCLNYLRDQKKYDLEILDIEGIGARDELQDNDNLVSDELKLKIDEIITGLPEKCREIFHLSRNENKKYKDIAQELNISVKTVEAQMSKALKIMRKKLADFL